MSKVRQIKRNIKQEINPLYYTLVGSIITTIGILTGKSEIQNKKLYQDLNKHKQILKPTVQEITDYIWTIYGNDELIKLRANIVLVYDKLGVRVPMVTLINPETETLLPLKQNGEFTGILKVANEGRDYIGVEYLYDEDGNKFEGDDNE